jgi:hypothetical protein
MTHVARPVTTPVMVDEDQCPVVTVSSAMVGAGRPSSASLPPAPKATAHLPRRAALGLAAAAGMLTARSVRAQTPAEVKIAMLVPLSGPGHARASWNRWAPTWRSTTSTMPAASSRWVAPS